MLKRIIMKTINEEDVLSTLVRVEVQYRGDLKDFTICEQDEILEQLMTMKIFLAELAQKLRDGKEFDYDFAHEKLEIVKNYLDDLESLVKVKIPVSNPNSTQDDPYASYSVHSE